MRDLFPGRQFITTALESLEVKADMTSGMKQRYMMRAVMAGIIIGIMYISNFATAAAFADVTWDGGSMAPLGKFVGAWVFGPALVFIYYTKSELLTSNMMVFSLGKYYKRISTKKGLQILGLCFAGNAIGGLFMALMMKFSTIITPGMMKVMDGTIEHKLAYFSEGATGVLDLFIRAVFCNFMINIGMLLVYNGIIHDDVLKAIVMIVAVFVFAFLGFEHSVANTVVLTIYGFVHGVDVLAAVGNVLVALVGNFIGGGVLIGLYYAYLNDEGRALRKGVVPGA